MILEDLARSFMILQDLTKILEDLNNILQDLAGSCKILARLSLKSCQNLVEILQDLG